LKIVHFQRAEGVGVSIERVFEHIRSAFPQDLEVEVRCLPCAGVSLRALFRNLWFAYRNRGDVNHITGDCHYLALGLPGKRTILTVHDCAYVSWLRGVRRFLFKVLWFDLPCRRVGILTAISCHTRDQLKRLMPRLRREILVVPDCVDPSFVCIAPVASSPAVLLQVGTSPQKNLERVALALAGLPCKLRIIGSLSEGQRQLLEDLKLDYSTCSGIDDAELRMEYAACTAVVFASLEEGFGLPILEAQASGRPVITSDRSPMRDVAGDGALFVDPEDVGSIREQAELVLLEDVRVPLVSRGLENVQKYAAIDIARRYRSLYEMILPHRRMRHD
jgi:glycosyltransferase involved in cell wall biosynthesis